MLFRYQPVGATLEERRTKGAFVVVSASVPGGLCVCVGGCDSWPWQDPPLPWLCHQASWVLLSTSAAPTQPLPSPCLVSILPATSLFCTHKKCKWDQERSKYWRKGENCRPCAPGTPVHESSPTGGKRPWRCHCSSFFLFLFKKIIKVMCIHGEKDNGYKSLLLAPSSKP